MPMRTVTLRRWEVVTAFLIVTVSFTVGLWLLSQRVSRNDLRLSRNADRIAIEAEVQKQRNAQLARVSAANRASDCARSRALFAYLDARHQLQPLPSPQIETLYQRYKATALQACK
jgi:hypothetical protein